MSEVEKMKGKSAQFERTAWWNEERVLVQLREAVAICERHYVHQPVQRDHFAHAENVSAWIAMTSAHSLVEQALKAVLRRRGRSEAELRGVAGHDLGVLYDALPPVDKRTVEQELLAFAGRYGGMPWGGVAEFLSSVAHDYEGWRYLLIEITPHDLSTTHPEALLAIARGLVRSLVAPASAPEPVDPESPKPAEGTAPQGEEAKPVDAMRKKQWRNEKPRVDGLNKAAERLKLHLGDNYRLVNWIDPDQHQSASAWMAITCGYSLLEQALKALLHRRGDSRAERGGFSGHRIDKLYGWLPGTDKAIIEQGFAAYTSLFDEIADSSASDFLRRVGRSYNGWRYLLIERPRKPLSAIHPGALLEVAGLVVETLANETFTDHGMHFVARRLRHRVVETGINGALQERALERHEKGLAQEAMDPLNDWIREAPNLLTGYAAYLRGEIPNSELVADVLRRAEQRLDQAAARPGGLDLRRFLERARDAASPLTWDSAKCLFVKG